MINDDGVNRKIHFTTYYLIDFVLGIFKQCMTKMHSGQFGLMILAYLLLLRPNLLSPDTDIGKTVQWKIFYNEMSPRETPAQRLSFVHIFS